MPTKKTTAKTASGRVAASRSATTDPIQHIVVLMLENRSFDQILGSLQTVLPEVNGSIALNKDGTTAPPRFNLDDKNVQYEQKELSAEMLAKDQYYDPKHEHPNVMYQIDGPNGPNNNFVRDFSLEYPESSQVERQFIMSYYPLDSLPALHALAREFTICDHWFSSVPGPTWANRLFAHTGTSQGKVRMPENELDPIIKNIQVSYTQDTIYDRLQSDGVSWKVYFSDWPASAHLLTHQWQRYQSHYHDMDEFFEDAEGDAAKFPAYSFIEPQYFYLTGTDPGDPLQPDLNHPPNDCHPPHSVFEGERLIAAVYNRLRANVALWNTSLLVVLFDEHGGFYDHEVPPQAVPPDALTETFTYRYKDSQVDTPFNFRFDRLGCRVPALLVSPWVDRTVVKKQFDHTSLLRYIVKKWNLDRFGALGARVMHPTTKSIGVAITSYLRTDTLKEIVIPPRGSQIRITTNQKAIIAANKSLSDQMDPHVKVALAIENSKRFLPSAGNKITRSPRSENVQH